MCTGNQKTIEIQFNFLPVGSTYANWKCLKTKTGIKIMLLLFSMYTIILRNEFALTV